MKTPTIFSFVFAAALVGVCAGCSHPDSDELDTTVKKIAFEGAPDPKFAGTWKTEDGVSTYTIKADGSYELASKIQVAKQKPIDSHLTGNWAVKADQMLFKDQSGNVSGYTFALEGTKLTLVSNGTLKAKTVMDKQP